MGAGRKMISGKNRISKTEQTNRELIDNGQQIVTPSESTD